MNGTNLPLPSQAKYHGSKVMLIPKILAWVIILLWLPIKSQAGKPTPAQLLHERAQAYAEKRFSDCVGDLGARQQAGMRNPDLWLFLHGQCSFYSGQFRQAHRSFDRLQKRFPHSPHAVLAAYRLADSSWAMAYRRRAVAEYRRAADLLPSPSVDPVVGLVHRYRYHCGKNHKRMQARLWRHLARQTPAHVLVEALRAEGSLPVLSFSDVMASARALHKARRWESALAVLDGAGKPSSQEQRFELAYRTGRILFDMRDRYPQALAMLQSAKDHAPDPTRAEQAWFYASRALGRLDRDPEAIASHLAMVARFPTGIHAARALYYAGWLEQNRGQCDLAMPWLEKVWAVYADSSWAVQARWYASWCHLRNRQWAKALAGLGAQVKLGSAETGGRALYWSAVAHQALGQVASAQAVWHKTIRRHPLSWYSLLSRLRLGSAAPPLPPPAPAPARAQPPLDDRLFVRSSELMRAGLSPLAGALLRHREADFLARRQEGLMSLLGAYRAVGEFHRPWLLTLRKFYGSLLRLPTTSTRERWDHAYPACHRDLLLQHTGDDHDLARFLQAIMRTESGFDAQALSVANARGLLQMIPPTARKVAAYQGLTYADEKLFEPSYNIQTAAWYIGRLLKKFHGQWPLAAGAYNSSAPAMMDWCRELGHMELDEFVESVPWTESRRYIKRVISAWARYAYLEGASLPALDLKLRADFLEDEIDF